MSGVHDREGRRDGVRRLFIAASVGIISIAVFAPGRASGQLMPSIAHDSGEHQVVVFGDRLISVPSGRHFYGSQFQAMTADGSHVAVWSSSDLTVPYQDEGLGGGLFDLTSGLAVRVAQCNSCGVFAVSADGSAFVAWSSSRLTPSDTDTTPDVYLFDAAGAHAVSAGTDGLPTFVDMAEDASFVVFGIRIPLADGDLDATEDLYRWSRATGVVELVSPGVYPPIYEAMSDNGQRIFFRTSENLLDLDLGTSGEDAIYEWRNGTVSLRGRGSFVTIRDGGASMYMNTKLPLDPADIDSQTDGYVNDAGGNHLLTNPSAGYALLDQVRADGAAWTFGTADALTADDADTTGDIYLASEAGLTLISRGAQSPHGLLMDAGFGSAIYSTRSQLVPADTDDWEDVYRWSAEAPQAPELLSGSGTPNVTPLAYAQDGSRALMTSNGQHLPEDTDPYFDVYEFTAGHLALVFPGSQGYDVHGWTQDLKRVVVSAGALTAEDTNGNVDDVYFSDARQQLEAPATVISANPDPAYVYDPVTFTVTVDPVPDAGSVELVMLNGLNEPVGSLGTQTVSTVDGTATWTRAFGYDEPRRFRAFYSGTAITPPAQSEVFERQELHPPSVLIRNKPNRWHPLDYADFTFETSSSVSGPVDLECSIDEGTWDPCSPATRVEHLADGPHSLQVRATDSNGRTGGISFWDWRVDTSPPEMTVVVNSGAPFTNDNLAHVQVTATDQHSVDEIDVALDGSVDENGQPTDPQRTDFPYSTAFDWDFTSPFRGGTGEDGPRTLFFWTRDPLGNWTDPFPISFVYDTHAPTGVNPSVGIPTGRFGSDFPVRVSWSTASDVLSGIAEYDLQRKVGKNPFHTVNSATPLSTTFEEALRKGSNYRYRLNSVDGATNVSQWSPEVAFKPTVRQEASAAVTRSGNWTVRSVSGSSGGNVLRSGKAGSTVKTSFTGMAIAWVSTMGPTMGQAQVFVDGGAQPVATIDLHRSSISTRQIVWSKTFATGGLHTVRIRVVGTPGHPSVDLDAFLILAPT